MLLIGQDKFIKLMKTNLIEDKNFIAIKGIKNSGKTYLCKFIANELNYEYILLDNKVETLRNLIKQSKNLKETIYHFKDFEKSSAAAKASLLKIAEETPPNIKIIISISNNQLLDTIKSRALIIDMQPYTRDELLEYCDKLQFDKNLFDKIFYNYSLELSPSLLFKFKQMENIEKIIELVEDSIMYINNGISIENCSLISSYFWSFSKDEVETYILFLLKSVKRLNKQFCYPINKIMQQALINLNTAAITNFRQLIHNMLMEML